MRVIYDIAFYILNPPFYFSILISHCLIISRTYRTWLVLYHQLNVGNSCLSLYHDGVRHAEWSINRNHEEALILIMELLKSRSGDNFIQSHPSFV